MSFSSVRQFIVRHERILSVAATALGFAIDNLFLGRADLLPGKLLLYFYFFSAGVLILLIHSAEERTWKGKTGVFLRPWLTLGLQFIFGSLYSAFLVFYAHSASFSVGWPFLLVLFAVFAGTEVFKKYQDQLVYQCGLYFFGLFSFCVYMVPLALGTVGTSVFLISGAVSIGVFALFVWILFLTGSTRLKTNSKRILVVGAIVYAVMNVLYFAHVLPPLPLSLKDIGVYHSVVRTENSYAALGESVSWLQEFLGTYSVHIQQGDAVYVFSSVFTPVAVKTNLVHRWEYWNGAQQKWTTTSLIQFPVSGGRDNGYRGFSEIPAIPEGKWRVSVETEDQALIGRIEFTVSAVLQEPPLQQSTL